MNVGRTVVAGAAALALSLVLADLVADDAADGRTADRTVSTAPGDGGTADRADSCPDGGVTLLRGHASACSEQQRGGTNEKGLGKSLSHDDLLCLPIRERVTCSDA